MGGVPSPRIACKLQAEVGTVQDPRSIVLPNGSVNKTRYCVPSAPRLFGHRLATATPDAFAMAEISRGTTRPFSVSVLLSRNLNFPPAIKDPSGLAAVQVTATVVIGIIYPIKNRPKAA